MRHVSHFTVSALLLGWVLLPPRVPAQETASDSLLTVDHYLDWEQAGDPQISPGNSVQYYKRVSERIGGPDKIHGSYRLFMVPGMGHCGGGDGPSSFDMVSALEQWVENGRAPDQIVASRVRDAKVDRTRPLCPYPQVATYKGTGSTDDAASFVCKQP